ncbi:MAG: GTP cyclohydrolase I [Candidatus Thorarchaeota archaeon]|jgi:GTP cyclohydrolase I
MTFREVTPEEELTQIGWELLNVLNVPVDRSGDDFIGHFNNTPKRFAKSMIELAIKGDGPALTTFSNPNDRNEMVYVGPIVFHSFCAHHIIPFFGEAHVAYIPNGKIIGLSKIPRLVKWVSKGLWVQEELTYDIAHHLNTALEPIGVAVMLKAEHLCMAMRGIREPGAKTVTTSLWGAFLEPRPGANPREEFFGIVNG